ncbi:MAG: tetratricopeptide repeat protein [Alphaproteobacteria bacterium]
MSGTEGVRAPGPPGKAPSHAPDGVVAALKRAVECHQQGRLQEAERLYRDVIEMMPGNFDALHMLGVIQIQRKNFIAAIDLIGRALLVKPDNAFAESNFGAALIELKRFDEALAHCDRALALDPNYPDAIKNRGIALRALGRHEEALVACDRALTLHPDNVDIVRMRGAMLFDLKRHPEALACFNRALAAQPDHVGTLLDQGKALRALGRAEQALASYDRALALRPDLAAALFSRGNASLDLGKPTDALASYERALALQPAYPEALNARGNALLDLKRYDEALASYDRALELKQDFAEALNNRGTALRALERYDEALTSYDRALSLQPNYAEALRNAAIACIEQGRHRDAVEYLDRAQTVEPDSTVTRWKRVLTTVPMVLEHDEDIGAFRAEFVRALANLEVWLQGRPDAYELVGNANVFYLAYQDANNRDLLGRYGALCARLMHQWQQGHGLPSKYSVRRDGPIRVGIVSAQLHAHSVWLAIVKGWFLHLDRSKFALHVFHLENTQDAETDRAMAQSSSFEQGVKTLPEWVDAIAGRQPDILIYPELGMHPMAYKLASLRLAPTQAAAWGHPETTGLPTIDHYLSAQAFEPPEAQDHYTEKLVCLPRLGCCYAPLSVPWRRPDLARLGIKQNVARLLCPGMPFKYTPAYDSVLIRIARQLGDCQFVFFASPKRPALTEKLRRRMAAHFAASGLAADDFVVFVPWQDIRDFFGLMHEADALLDTIGFSGFNTVMQAIECGLPVVTREGRFMRGRFGSGILRQLAMPELIARDDVEYAAIVARLVRDSAFRSLTRQRIAASRGDLFDDVAAVRALESYIEQASGAAAGRREDLPGSI